MAYNKQTLHPAVLKAKEAQKENVYLSPYGSDFNTFARSFYMIEHYNDNFDFYIERDVPEADELEAGYTFNDVIEDDRYEIDATQRQKDDPTSKKYDRLISRENQISNTSIMDQAAELYFTALYDSKNEFMRKHNIKTNKELAGMLRSTELSKSINLNKAITPEQETAHITKLLNGFSNYQEGQKSAKLDKIGTFLNTHLKNSVSVNADYDASPNSENLIEQLLLALDPIKKDEHMAKATYKLITGAVDGYSPDITDFTFDMGYKSLKAMC